MLERYFRCRSGERSVALQELPENAGYAMVIRYARMCAYMARASFGALSSYPLRERLFRFFILISFLFVNIINSEQRACEGRLAFPCLRGKDIDRRLANACNYQEETRIRDAVWQTAQLPRIYCRIISRVRKRKSQPAP